LVLLIFVGLLVGVFSFLIPDSRYLALARIWHSCVVRLIGVRCHFYGERIGSGCLVVCNHISWADISVIGSRLPVIFLAKSEIRQWPILGWMIEKAGTIFIARGKGATKAIRDLSDALKKGRSVLIFPEGRTTQGRTVLKFQPRLFQSAIDAGGDVQPIAIRYRDKNGNPAERISYVGSASLFQSLWRVLMAPGIYAEVRLFQSGLSAADRQKLSTEAETLVRSWVEKH